MNDILDVIGSVQLINQWSLIAGKLNSSSEEQETKHHNRITTLLCAYYVIYIYILINACTLTHGSGNVNNVHMCPMHSPLSESQHTTSSRVKCSCTVHTQIKHFHVHCRACTKESSFCGCHAQSCSRALTSIDTSDTHTHTHTHTHLPSTFPLTRLPSCI